MECRRGRRKRLLLVRHAESAFNARRRGWALLVCGCCRDPGLIDAELTARGERQAAELAARAASEGLFRDVQLVVCSPLTRALRTLELAFAGSKARVLVSPLPREVMDHSCDIGSPPNALAARFPALDFSALPRVWWHVPASGDEWAVEKEPCAAVAARVAELKRLLLEAPEETIAVISHSKFLLALTGTSRHIENCQVLCATLSPDGELRLEAPA